MSKKEIGPFKLHYSDVNDHYTDEHLIMTYADLLEQMYSKDHSLNFSNLLGMIAAMHDITRHRDLFVKKPPKGSEKGEIMDPNTFPI
jgi:hypothetical protein